MSESSDFATFQSSWVGSNDLCTIALNLGRQISVCCVVLGSSTGCTLSTYCLLIVLAGLNKAPYLMLYDSRVLFNLYIN